VKSYIKRGRRKYRRVGVDLGTKLLLRRHAIREGWIPPE
jgi:two-component system, NarL family, uhpT operon response regulator UhpA